MDNDNSAERPLDAGFDETLQESIERLRAIARAMDDLPNDRMTVEDVQATARHQARMRTLAAELVVRQIDLLTGDARVSATEINAAVRYAQQAIAEVRTIRAVLGEVAGLIEFVGVVLTGDRTAIARSAIRMRSRLSP